MLYETLNHPNLFIIFFIIGLLNGFIYDIGNFIKFLCNNKKVACFLIDFIQTTIALVITFYSNLVFHYGQIRIIIFVIICIAFYIERLTIGKIVAKFYFKCYLSFYINLF